MIEAHFSMNYVVHMKCFTAAASPAFVAITPQYVRSPKFPIWWLTIVAHRILHERLNLSSALLPALLLSPFALGLLVVQIPRD
jgi:hypothetical protein